jgi:hypothetical protein
MLSEEKTEQNLVFCLAYLHLYIAKYIHLDHYEETNARVFDTLLDILKSGRFKDSLTTV